MSDELQQVSREIVSVGIDFRPIPLNLGDGEVWEFLSDPDSDQWQAVVDALKGLREVGNDEGATVKEATTALSNTLGSLLVSTQQKTAWKKRGYGLMPLQRTANVLMEQWTGFPTK